eukprot:SAG31_NODE_528_length_14438_cov_2.252877_8_plen_95_part_00
MLLVCDSAGWEMTSQRLGELEVGEEIVVSDYRHVDVHAPDGILRTITRARFDRGWTSAVSSSGVQILRPIEKTPTAREVVMQVTGDYGMGGMLP